MFQRWRSKRAYEKGLRSLEWGDYEGALRHADRAIALRYTGGDEVKARALYESGREDEAIEILEAAANSHPSVWVFWSYLGEYLSNAGRYPEALNAFRRFEENGGDSGTAQYNYAIVYGRMGDLDSAISAVNRAFGAAVPEHVVLAARANFLNRLGRHSEALDDIDRALAHEVTSGSLATRALILDDMGRRQEALDCARESLLIKVAEHDALEVVSRSNPLTDDQSKAWRITYEAKLDGNRIEPGGLPIDGYMSTFWATANSPEEAMSYLPSIDVLGREFKLKSFKDVGEAIPGHRGITHLQGKTFFFVAKNPIQNALLRLKALVHGRRNA